MSSATYYTTLGLVPSAAPEVIRAAYKALALICHPDKTIHLPAEERASHAAVFNQVQAAFDVLSNPPLKAAYDAELARHDNKVDEERSTFHRPSNRAASKASSNPQRRNTLKLTTPEEKIAMRSQARQTLEYLREKRAQRDTEDAQMDVAGLRDLVEIWKDLAEENRTDPPIQAHCAIRIYEYEEKITDREQRQREWLAKMSTAKQGPSASAANQCPTTPDAPKKSMAPSSSTPSHTSHTSRPRTKQNAFSATSPTPAIRNTARAEERKRVEAERTAAAAARAQIRMLEKAQREAVKQAQMEQKTAAVRAEKEKLKAKVELQAQKDAERIAKARAKAGAAPLGPIGAAVETESSHSDSRWVSSNSKGDEGEAQAVPSAVGQAAPEDAQTRGKRLCGKCGIEHAGFHEWRKCNMQAAPASTDEDQPFLRTV